MLDRGLNHAQTNLFQALADETRLAILQCLTEREHNVGDLVEALNREQSAISHHLRCLRNCGLVRTRKAGKEVHYSLDDNGNVRQLLQLARTHVQATLNAILACDVLEPPSPGNVRLQLKPERLPG